jgi:hypothetical protein
MKVELSTIDKPEVLGIARRLGVTRDDALGKVIRLWGWFNAHSVDGIVVGAVDADIDALVLHEGFATALREVGWLGDDPAGRGVGIPKFDRHTSESAKNRALKAERQARWRDGRVDGPVDDSASTPLSLSSSSSLKGDARGKQRATGPLFVPPGWIPGPVWDAFEAMRRKIRKPMTERARELVVIELEKLRAAGEDPVAVLEQSIRNDWQDVYPVKLKAGSGAAIAPLDRAQWWRSPEGVRVKAAEYGLVSSGDIVPLRARVYLRAGDGPWLHDSRFCNATVKRLMEEIAREEAPA